MSNQTRFTRWCSAALVAALVAACGGGGGSVGGIDRLGVTSSSGSITQIGSIFVNGVEWRTDTADITVDDTSGIESELRVGQVVVVTGDLDPSGTSGRAETVDVDSLVDGPIASINTVAETFVVLGQTVRVLPSTAFDDSLPDRNGDQSRTFADLRVGDAVEISGFRDSGNVIRATRIERDDDGDLLEVRGVVTSADASNNRFNIGSLTVDYDGAALDDGFSPEPAVGQFVEAEGVLSGGILVADSVELEDGLSSEEGDEAEVEGYITDFTSASAVFRVNGVRVQAGAGIGAGIRDQLDNNVKIEAEGEFNASGILIADDIEIRVQDGDEDVEIAGRVNSVVGNTVTIDDITIVIRVDAATRLEDSSDLDLPEFGLGDLVAGDYVEIRAAVDPSAATNDVIATRLERDEVDDEFILQGPVSAINEPEITILDVDIDTDIAVFLIDDEDVGEVAFFAALNAAPNPVVKVKADFADVVADTVLALEVELEDVDGSNDD